MGLLDDAIREHLELKRRRGGDPSEIERAERDALGPVRREPEPLQSAAYDQTEGAEAGTAPGPAGEDELYEHAFEAGGPDELADPYAHEPAVEHDEFTEHDEFGDPHVRSPGALPSEPAPPLPYGAVGTGPAAPASPEPFDLDEDDDPWVASPPGGELSSAMPHEEAREDAFAAPGHDPLPEAAEPPAGAPREHEAVNQETAEYRIEPAHRGEEDPLEETPEFLQDTPDHDRLWFEQRPPRDFDFDK